MNLQCTRALPKRKWKRCQLKRILLVWFIRPVETNFKKCVAMLYVLVNLWTKSDGTTSDKTIVQFRAIKLSFLKRTKSPPPTPYSILFRSKNQHWGIRRGTKTVIVLTMVFMFVRVTGRKKVGEFCFSVGARKYGYKDQHRKRRKRL